jgi:hypothetical protein
VCVFFPVVIFSKILNILKQRLKSEAQKLHPELAKQFDVTLFPNSVFIISLLTNRLYKHEIVPSTLNVDQIPVRLGYVIRCSNTKALFKSDKTWIATKGKFVELESSTREVMNHILSFVFFSHFFVGFERIDRLLLRRKHND